jgi:hypothetical protein
VLRQPQRRTAATVDVVAADWGFWEASLVPLDELRRRYGIPAVADELLALRAPPRD